MPGWLKVLIGIVIAVPVGFFGLVWYLENAFESGGCKWTAIAQGAVSGDVSYRILRLRCSLIDDEFSVAIGPRDARIAAIQTTKLEPRFVRAESTRKAIFTVGGKDLVVTLDGLGQPVDRIDVESDGRQSTTPHAR